jgi:maleylacetate reductase
VALRFAHETLGQRVLFGSGRAAENLEAEVARLGSRRVMLIASDREAEVVRKLSAGLPVELRFSEVVQHVPIDTAEVARAAARKHDVDLLVAIGGGSTVGMAKAVALSSGIPIIAVPTTYAGSEATNVWGLTEAGRKTTGVDPRVLPATVIYDAALTLGLPVALSIASGLNALAHCVDSLWGPRADPINAVMAAMGIRALAEGLPAVAADPAALPGREQALYGAYLSAVAFASAGSGMHHKICHVLGGTYNLPHAETHAIVLPHVLAFNAPFAPTAASRIAAALGTTDALAGLVALRDMLGAPVALRDVGFSEGDIPEAASIALVAIPESNPRPVTQRALERLLHAAWAGDIPTSSESEDDD